MGGVISGYHLRLDHAISFAGSAVLCNRHHICYQIFLHFKDGCFNDFTKSTFKTVSLSDCKHPMLACVGISHNSILRRPTVANSGQLAKRRTLESIGKVFANLLQTKPSRNFEVRNNHILELS